MKKIDLSELEKKYQSSPDVNARMEINEQYRAYLEALIEHHPKDVQSLIYLGALSWEPFHEHEKARKYLQKAIEYDPQNIEAYFWLGKCYFHDCDYDEARVIILEALKIDPKRPDCLSLFADIICDTTENWNEAIIYLERAVQSAPDWPMLRHILATLYLRVKDIKSAEFHIKKALELSSKTPIRPKNTIERYYENVVTGRSWENLEEEFHSLIGDIQAAKHNLLKN